MNTYQPHPDDQSFMRFGKHKGTVMINVPLSYLRWLREQSWLKDWKMEAAWVEQRLQQLDSITSAKLANLKAGL